MVKIENFHLTESIGCKEEISHEKIANPDQVHGKELFMDSLK